MILNLQWYGNSKDPGDREQAMALARLMADLTPHKRQEPMIFSGRFDSEFDEETIAYVSKKFVVWKFRGTRNATGWPNGPNQLASESFMYAVGLVRSKQLDDDCILFMEADDLPLKTTWIDDLQNEYRASGKKCMGALIKNGRTGAHLNGNMIMSLDFWRFCTIAQPPKHVAWDAYFAPQILKNGHPSKTIWSDYKLGEPCNPWKGDNWLWEPKVRNGPTDIYKGEELYPSFFHGCKVMQGIDCVRKRLIP